MSEEIMCSAGTSEDSSWWNSQHWQSAKSIRLTSDGKYHPISTGKFPVVLTCFDFDAANRLTPSFHDHLEIIHVHRGHGLLTMPDRQFTINEGEVVLIGNNVFHVVERDGASNLKIVALHFLPEALFSPGGAA